MDKRTFDKELKTHEALSDISSPKLRQYHKYFCMGLKASYFGSRYKDVGKHTFRMSLYDSPDLDHHLMGAGYREGYLFDLNSTNRPGPKRMGAHADMTLIGPVLVHRSVIGELKKIAKKTGIGIPAIRRTAYLEFIMKSAGPGSVIFLKENGAGVLTGLR